MIEECPAYSLIAFIGTPAKSKICQASVAKIVGAPTACYRLAIANANTLGSFFQNVPEPMIRLRENAASAHSTSLHRQQGPALIDVTSHPSRQPPDRQEPTTADSTSRFHFQLSSSAAHCRHSSASRPCPTRRPAAPWHHRCNSDNHHW